jgi:hypothetical protein
MTTTISFKKSLAFFVTIQTLVISTFNPVYPKMTTMPMTEPKAGCLVYVVFHYEEIIVEDKTEVFTTLEAAEDYQRQNELDVLAEMTRYLQACKRESIEPTWKKCNDGRGKKKRYLWFPNGNDEHISLGHHVSREWGDTCIAWWKEWDGVSPIEEAWLTEVGEKLLWLEETFTNIHPIPLQ